MKADLRTSFHYRKFDTEKCIYSLLYDFVSTLTQYKKKLLYPFHVGHMPVLSNLKYYPSNDRSDHQPLNDEKKTNLAMSIIKKPKKLVHVVNESTETT